MQWNGARMLDFIFASQDCKLQGNWRFEHSTMVCPRTQIKLYIPPGHKRPLWCEYFLKLLDLHGQFDTKNHQPFLARLIPFWAFPICFVESNCVHPIVNTILGMVTHFKTKRGWLRVIGFTTLSHQLVGINPRHWANMALAQNPWRLKLMLYSTWPAVCVVYWYVILEQFPDRWALPALPSGND